MISQMDRVKVPFQLINEADKLSKETGISFRDCLDMVCKLAESTERTGRVKGLQRKGENRAQS